MTHYVTHLSARTAVYTRATTGALFRGAARTAKPYQKRQATYVDGTRAHPPGGVEKVRAAAKGYIRGTRCKSGWGGGKKTGDRSWDPSHGTRAAGGVWNRTAYTQSRVSARTAHETG